jgi:uncharacterized protein (DUF2141 family)
VLTRIAQNSVSMKYAKLPTGTNERFSWRVMFTGLKKQYFVINPEFQNVGILMGFSDKEGSVSYGNLPTGLLRTIPNFAQKGVQGMKVKCFQTFLETYPVNLLEEHLYFMMIRGVYEGKLDISIYQMKNKIEEILAGIYKNWKKWVGNKVKDTNKVLDTNKTFAALTEDLLKWKINKGASAVKYNETLETLGEMFKNGISMPFQVFQFAIRVMNRTQFKFSSTDVDFQNYLFFELSLLNGRFLHGDMLHLSLLRFFRKLFQAAFSDANLLYKSSNMTELLRTEFSNQFDLNLVTIIDNLKKEDKFKNIANDIDLELNNHFNFAGFVAYINPRVAVFLHRLKYLVLEPFVSNLIASDDFMMSISDEDPDEPTLRTFSLAKFMNHMLFISRDDSNLDSLSAFDSIPDIKLFNLLEDRRMLLV